MKNPNLAAIYDDRSFAGHPGGTGDSGSRELFQFVCMGRCLRYSHLLSVYAVYAGLGIYTGTGRQYDCRHGSL